MQSRPAWSIEACHSFADCTVLQAGKGEGQGERKGATEATTDPALDGEAAAHENPAAVTQQALEAAVERVTELEVFTESHNP